MDKYSSCCGTLMNDAYADMLVCPDCKEHCGVEKVKPDVDMINDLHAELDHEEGKV